MAPQIAAAASDDAFWLSPFVFTGKLRQRRASTLAVVDVTELDAIVAVERVIRRPEGVIDFSGQDVTLRGDSALDLDPEQTMVFAANGWLYGDSVALIEVARLNERELRDAERRVEEAEQRAAVEALRSRITRADVVVVARVVKTNPVGGKERPPVSEHDPLWAEAWLEIESVEKGKAPQRPRVLFPTSTDEYWYESPKFSRGDHGIFFLQQNQQERGPRQYRVRGYTALHPLDFQPRERLDEIRELIKPQR